MTTPNFASLVAQLVKNPPCNSGDMGLAPGLGRSPGEGKGYPLQYSGLENSVGYIVHGGHKESDITEQLSLSLSNIDLTKTVMNTGKGSMGWFKKVKSSAAISGSQKMMSMQIYQKKS